MRSEAFAILLRITIIPFIVREFIQKKRITILCYHNISPILFTDHIMFMMRHYSIISLRQFIEALRTNRLTTLPKKSVIITFDDGVMENYNLLPVIKKYCVPMTIFLVTDVVGTHKHYWFKEVQEKYKDSLKALDDEERLDGLEKTGFRDEREYETRQSLSHSEILEMKEAGVDFQSHTHTHPILPRCTSNKVRDEFTRSRNFIESINSCYAIAYPNGDYSEREVSIGTEVGYQAGLTIDHGYNTGKTEPLQLRRIVIGDDLATHHVFTVQVTGLWRMLRAKRMKLRHRTQMTIMKSRGG